MSSIITSILSSTVGLLCNKVRDKTAAKLKDGDIADAKIREIVVRELNDIKTKLYGLSRKDLLSSYIFLQEGVDLLNVSLNKAKGEEKTLPVLNEAGRGETSTEMRSGVESSILKDALELCQAMRKLTVDSNKEFESARERFKEARKRATDAFCNEALSIEDRIFAAKLRIVAEILECLESPETAITGCLSFLKRLHGLPAIREMFSVYLNGGVKSMMSKAERAENIKSVMLINYVSFQFVLKFRSKYSFAFTWPTIELADYSFNPIVSWRVISTRKSMREQLIQSPNGVLIDEEKYLVRHFAVNSHGDVVVTYGDNIKVISKTGESKVVKIPDFGEGGVIEQYMRGLAVDSNDNFFLAKWLKTQMTNGDVKSHVLYVLDENCNVKHDHALDFLDSTNPNLVKIAVNKNNNIIVMQDYDPHVYVCDSTGQFKHKFERDSRRAVSLSVTDKNEIMIPSAKDEKAVDIYTEKGKIKFSINVPEDHVVFGVAFHYGISKIIVLTCIKKKDSCFLLCYSDTGDLETLTYLCKNIDRLSSDIQIKSHPSGPVLVVRNGSIDFI